MAQGVGKLWLSEFKFVVAVDMQNVGVSTKFLELLRSCDFLDSSCYLTCKHTHTFQLEVPIKLENGAAK